MSTQTNPDQESANPSSRDTEGESVTIPPDWLAEFEAAARRPLEVRMRYSFIHTYKPVMDDASYRSFDTMEDYRPGAKRIFPPG